MTKKIFEDMVKVKRARAGKEFSAPKIEIKNEQAHPVIHHKHASVRPKVYNPGGARAGRGIWVAALGAVIFLLFAVSLLFSSATIAIIPHEEEFSLSKEFYAVLDSTTTLPFNLVVVEGEEETLLPAGERREVEESATGKVAIYNNYSSATQTLDINTRLEGDNGKIYKTSERVVVPGRGADGTPGSVEVDIYASEAGEEYNSGPMDFTIVGFRGGPKYEGFYARALGDISGGLTGNMSLVSEEDKAKVGSEMRQKLSSQLSARAAEQLPPGFVLFEGAVFLEVLNEELDAKRDDGLVAFKMRAVLYGLLFDEKKLTASILADVLPEGASDSDVYIPDLRGLTFAFATQPESLRDSRNISFHLSGRYKAVYRVDSEEIISKMLGRKRKDFSAVLLEYPSIDSADLTLRPLWRKAVPNDPDKVKAVVHYPKSSAE